MDPMEKARTLLNALLVINQIKSKLNNHFAVSPIRPSRKDNLLISSLSRSVGGRSVCLQWCRQDFDRGGTRALMYLIWTGVSHALPRRTISSRRFELMGSLTGLL